MLTDEVPRPSGPAVRRGARVRRRLLRALIVAAALVLLLAGLTARLFVWPPAGMPDRVDAILMLNNPGDPQPVALQLAREHRARYLVVSQGTVASHYACPAPAGPPWRADGRPGRPGRPGNLIGQHGHSRGRQTAAASISTRA